jgi:hypothetical protein
MNIDTGGIIQHLENIVVSSKNIGVLGSGGLDSGVLIFLLLQLSSNKGINNRIKVFTVPRIDDSKIHATSIVHYLEQKFNRNLGHTIIGDITLPTASQQIVSGISTALKDQSLDIILTADTKVPDFELIPDQPNPTRVRGHVARFDQPFFNYTKDHTVNLGITFEVDEIFRLSHSCVVLQKGRCNSCWWCKEREWAFFKNNYSDPGTN